MEGANDMPKRKLDSKIQVIDLLAILLMDEHTLTMGQWREAADNWLHFCVENTVKTHKAKTADCRKEDRGGKKKAQNMQEASKDVEASTNVVEYAGKASVTLSASDCHSWLSSLAAAN
ncbi:hypothetical protein NEOLEDRAFT_1175263 [Neolentinus lepideus HHB14362 ss-1]|uniref:Uncharacterized protein n=1 Tax=Neolentinus lepideus HHB14362 ss-1 TaxID=1314782 RepID=A0A165UZ85_9AGAM|nr:hypothetical protein NEOLEDRAFT_1175263 [Neolentinus lepideus HHB14362 ss-1]